MSCHSSKNPIVPPLENITSVHYFSPTNSAEDPKNGSAYGYRGLAYLRIPAYDEAITDFNEVIRHHPKHTAAYYCRGLAYLGKADADFKESKRLGDLEDEARLRF